MRRGVPLAGTTPRLLRRWLPPPRPPAAAHAGAAGGRAWAGTIGLGFPVGAGAHFVERGFARTFARIPHPRLRRATLAPRAGGGGSAARDRDRPGGGGVADRELGGAPARDLVPQARPLPQAGIGSGP